MSSVEMLAKQAAQQDFTKQALKDYSTPVRLLLNFGARPALGAGLGFLASGLADSVVNEFDLGEVSPEERRKARHRAMLAGAGVGLGKGVLSEAHHAGHFPFEV